MKNYGSETETMCPFSGKPLDTTTVIMLHRKIIYHPQSGWFEDTPLKGGTEAGYPLKGVEEGTSLLGLRSVGGTTTALR